MNIITIDCGASFIKGARFVNGNLEKVIQYNSPRVSKNKDIFSIWQITQLADSVKKMILELSKGERAVKLCIANEMHGFLLCFSNGRPYTDYISWQTELGSLPVDGKTAVSSILHAAALKNEIQHTGMPLRAGLPSSNLYFLKMTERLRSKEKLYFYTLGDYLLRFLSGREPYIHPTNAAAAGLYDLTVNKWNKKLISYIADDAVVFPDVGVKELFFKLEGVNIYAISAIGDQQAALLGAGLKEEDLSFNLGTGAQVSRVVTTVRFRPDYQVRPFFGEKYLQTIPHIPAGRALNVYFRFVKSVLEAYGFILKDSEIYAGMAEAEKNGLSTDIFCDLSFFENAVTDNSQGAILHIDENTFTIGSLMKAVFFQISENLLRMADSIAENPEEIKRIVFSGGIARRMESVRDQILEHYPGKAYIVSENETLIGLYLYSRFFQD